MGHLLTLACVMLTCRPFISPFISLFISLTGGVGMGKSAAFFSELGVGLYILTVTRQARTATLRRPGSRAHLPECTEVHARRHPSRPPTRLARAQVVHELYAEEGVAVPLLKATFPGVTTPAGSPNLNRPGRPTGPIVLAAWPAQAAAA